MTTSQNRTPYGTLLAATAFLVPLTAAIQNRAMAPLFLVLGVAMLALHVRQHGWPIPWRPAAVVLAAVTAFGAASIAWTRGEVRDAVQWVGQETVLFTLGLSYIAAARRASAADARLISRLALLGGAAALAAYGISAALHRTVQPGLVLAALIAWLALPLLLRLERGRGMAVAALAGVLGAAAVGFGSLSAVLAILAGAGTALLMWLAPRRGPVVLVVAVALWVFALPLVAANLPTPYDAAHALPKLSNSTVHRLAIYRGTAELIPMAPLLGHGANAARGIPEGQDEVTYQFVVNGKMFSSRAERIPLHPHNAVLQIWLELGLVGASLLVALMAVLVGAIQRLADPLNRALATGMLFAVFAVENVSFGAWQSWWLAAIMLLAGLAVVVFRNQPAQR